MTPERWQEIRTVFEKLVTLDRSERSPQLKKMAAADPELHREVESLLDYEGRVDSGFLNTAAANLLKPEGGQVSSRIGHRVGVYQILEEIGHGGMGEVYRAARVDGQYEKLVAVKLVRAGAGTALIVERFRSERQILATLDHPNIARLLDGGTTADGIPYLVMELIEGERIDTYADAHALSISQRLALFREVCAAVHYAHQRLVIHHDIKPSNILVTSEGVPKLLDFGIAKIVDPAGDAETTQVRPMTPEYASPEQIRGEAITTASDVYSLGVVLYQLLTGRSPYPDDLLPHQVGSAVCDSEPGKPSTVVLKFKTRPATQTGEHLSPEQVSSVREGSPRKLCRRLAGDLDDIALMALRKEPERRYGSVEVFAEDIRRHLEGLPVIARRGSWRYRANKFIRRHRAGVAAAAAMGLVLAAGIGATIREARIAQIQRARAEKRFQDVRQLADSLMFEIHDSIEGLPGATTSRKLIVQRSREYLDRLAEESTGDISLQRELASAYERLGNVEGDAYGSSLGDAKGGLQSLEKAVAIRQAIVAANPNNVEDLIALTRAYHETGRIEWYTLGGTQRGLQNLQQAVTIGESAVRMAPENINAIEALARAYQYLGDIQGGSGLRGGTNNLRDALQNHRKALPLLQKVADSTPSDPGKVNLLSRATIGVGDDYLRTGDAQQALTSYQKAEEILRPVADKMNNAVYRRGYAVCHTRMGDALLMLGRPSDALAHYRKERQLLEPLALADPKDMVVQSTFATSEGDIGHALVEAGQVQRGKATLLRAMAKTVAYAKAVGDSYSKTLLASTAALLGEAFERGRDYANAQRYYAQALELYQATSAADPADAEDAVNVVIMRNHRAGARLKSENTTAALEEYRYALNAEDLLAASAPDNVELLYAQADTYTGLGDISRALALRSSDHQESSRQWVQARDWYAKSLTTWQRISGPAAVSPNLFQVTSPRDVARRLSECKTRLAGSNAKEQPTV
jgi:eukaryotic-like serine/threonine-protein kinase